VTTIVDFEANNTYEEEDIGVIYIGKFNE